MRFTENISRDMKHVLHGFLAKQRKKPGTGELMRQFHDLSQASLISTISGADEPQ